MSMKDVRDYLLKQMAELADSDATAEEQAARIERAKATSQVAQTYIQAVKTELDAIRVMDDTGRLPLSVEAPARIERDGRVLSLEPTKGRAA